MKYLNYQMIFCFTSITKYDAYINYIINRRNKYKWKKYILVYRRQIKWINLNNRYYAFRIVIISCFIIEIS